MQPVQQLPDRQVPPGQPEPLARFVFEQPTPIRQVSAVQELPSSQLSGGPAVQVPLWQVAGAHGSLEHDVPLPTLLWKH